MDVNVHLFDGEFSVYFQFLHFCTVYPSGTKVKWSISNLLRFMDFLRADHDCHMKTVQLMSSDALVF